MPGTEVLKRILSVKSFSDNVRRFFFKKLNHNLWTRNEIIGIFSDAQLEAHMQVLKDLEEASIQED